MAAGFWASCYAIRPSQTVARPLVEAAARSRQGASMQAAYNRAMASATATVQRLSWLRAVSAWGRGHACMWGLQQQLPPSCCTRLLYSGRRPFDACKPLQLARGSARTGPYRVVLKPVLKPSLPRCCSQSPGVDPSRLTVSLAESLCLRAAIKPATFPFKLWAAYKLTLLTKRRGGGGSGGSGRHGSGGAGKAGGKAGKGG